MYYRIDAVCRQPSVCRRRHAVNQQRQPVAQYGAENVERQKEYQKHNQYKNWDGKIFVCQHTVNLHTADMLPAFLTFDNGFRADLFYEIIPHIGQSGVPVHRVLCFHFDYAVFNQLQLILAQVQLFRDGCVAFNQFCCGKAYRNARPFRMVFNLVADGVYAAVYRTGGAEIIDLRIFLLLHYPQSTLHQLTDTLVFHCTDGNDRNPQLFGHSRNVYRAAVAAHFVHHIQCKDGRYFHFNQLQSQVKVAFDIRRVHNVDNAVRLFVQYKIPRDDFLVGIRADGINAGKVNNGAVFFFPNGADFLVDGHAGEVSDMLI